MQVDGADFVSSPPIILFQVSLTQASEPLFEELGKQSRFIFKKLQALTKGRFRVALIGFGSNQYGSWALSDSANNNNQNDFEHAVEFVFQKKLANGDGTKADGFTTIVDVAKGILKDLGAATRFCPIVFTTHFSHGDDEESDTVPKVASFLKANFETKTPVYAIGNFPESSDRGLNQTYSRLASLTGGQTVSIQDFFKSPSHVLDFVLSDCMRVIAPSTSSTTMERRILSLAQQSQKAIALPKQQQQKQLSMATKTATSTRKTSSGTTRKKRQKAAGLPPVIAMGTPLKMRIIPLPHHSTES